MCKNIAIQSNQRQAVWSGLLEGCKEMDYFVEQIQDPFIIMKEQVFTLSAAQSPAADRVTFLSWVQAELVKCTQK